VDCLSTEVTVWMVAVLVELVSEGVVSVDAKEELEVDVEIGIGVGIGGNEVDFVHSGSAERRDGLDLVLPFLLKVRYDLAVDS
jgi:hypothetical protein